MMFGEYFPNPGFASSGLGVTMGTAILAEALGTFLLVLMVFVLTEGCNVGRPADGLAPVFIGATVTAVISIVAPLTQAGLNPARDFGPRLVAYLAGWNTVAIPGPSGGFFLVYIAGPLMGGVVAAICFRFLIAPLMLGHSTAARCPALPLGEQSGGLTPVLVPGDGLTIAAEAPSHTSSTTCNQGK